MKKRIIALLLCAAVILSSGCSANSDSLPDNTSKEYASSEPVSDTTDTSGGASDGSSQQEQTDAPFLFSVHNRILLFLMGNSPLYKV